MSHPRRSPYILGLDHGKRGLPSFAHRNGRNYDSRRANESYSRGYAEGRRLRRRDSALPLWVASQSKDLPNGS